MAAGYEDCIDANFLRIDPALRLAIGRGEEAGAGQSRLSRLENEVLGTEAGFSGSRRFSYEVQRRSHEKKEEATPDPGR